MAKSKKQSLTWDLTPLLKSDSDPFIEKERKILKQQVNRFVKKWKARDDYLKKPAVLKEALDEYEAWAAKYGVAGQQGYYFGLRIEQESENNDVKRNDNQITNLATQLSNEMQFFTLRIARIDTKVQPKFLNYKGLSPYKHFLEQSFAEAQFLLTEPEEKILNLKYIPAHYNWVRMTSGFLSKEEAIVLNEKGKKAKLPFSKIGNLMVDSDNKKVRDTAAKAFNHIIAKHLDVAENELNSILTDKKINDELRGITIPEQNRHISDDIPTKVVETLVSTIEKSFDIPKRYFKLKAKLMKVKKLAYHERYAPYGKITKKYTFEEAFQLVDRTFKKLDPQFSLIINQFKAQGSFDVFPRKGKRDGAFCAHDLKNQPVYILLNFNGKVSDVLTIAHECGHGINNELMRVKQNSLNFHTILATAEVASTFMEDFVLQELLHEADEETRLTLLIEKLKDDIGSIMLQGSLYRFEQELHAQFREKSFLSKEEIGAIYHKHAKSYQGDVIDYYKGTENWWVRSPHLRSSFYNYQYASGLLISKALQHAVKNDPSFITKVKQFLSTGASISPYNTFKKLGIDISKASFWEQGLQEVAELLNEAEQLAKKLRKI